MSSNLIIRLRAGDDSCFKEIYDLYHFKVFCFVKKYTSQLADSEDVTQNVFIHLWKYRTKLDSGTDLEAILFKSSKQEISRWYKKQNRIFSFASHFAFNLIHIPYFQCFRVLNESIEHNFETKWD